MLVCACACTYQCTSLTSLEELNGVHVCTRVHVSMRARARVCVCVFVGACTCLLLFVLTSYPKANHFFGQKCVAGDQSEIC